MTGRYPESHGAHTNNIPLNRDEVTFAEILRRDGYKTGYAGKWHLDGTMRPGWVHPERSMGFEECDYMFNRGHWKKIEDMPMPETQPAVFPYSQIGDERTYTTDWLTSKAIDFLDRNAEHQFCYMLSYPDPHGPIKVRPPYDSLVSPADVVLPANFYPRWLPRWAARLQEKSPFGIGKPDREAALRIYISQYLGEVKLIDDCVGTILAKLKSLALFDKTIIVFTTDHGDYGGEHGLFGKNHLYETAYRIPMIIHWPKGLQSGTVIDDIISTVDFQPTILSLMNVSPSQREQGKDASMILLGHSLDWDDMAFFHHCNQHAAGVFTKQHHLALVEDGECMLFDRVSDPYQMSNLFELQSCQDVVRYLSNLVAKHHLSLGTPAAKWLCNDQSN